MLYREFPPPPPLDRLVRCFWSLEARADPRAGADPILPDGCAEIVFHHGDPFERSEPGGGPLALQHRTAVVGQIPRFLRVRPRGRVGLFGIRLRPEATGALLGVPAAELTGRSASLGDLWGPAAAAALEERVYGAATAAGRAAAAAEALRDRPGAPLPSPRAAAAVALAIRAAGRVPVDRLAAAAAVTPRHLDRLFAREVGLPPKTLLRILRFRATLRRLESAPPGATAGVALEGGYADQAHFCRDARDLAGEAPVRFLDGGDGLGTPFREGPAEVAFFQDGRGPPGETRPRSRGGEP